MSGIRLALIAVLVAVPAAAHQGDADSPGFYIYESTGGSTVFAPAIRAGSQECVEMPLVPAPAIEVDAGNGVFERDETNNFLDTSIPVRTACDVVPPPCTPTPPPTITQTPTAT